MVIKFDFVFSIVSILLMACVVSNCAVEDKNHRKPQKRGLWNLDYGGRYSNVGPGYGTLGGYGLGSAIDNGIGYAPPNYPTHVHTATTITKSVPVPHPYPVPVEKPVPYPVAAPYPVEVPRPYPVAVPKPYPVAVDKPYPVPVDRPYPVPVPVPQPYAVPVVKHVDVPVPQPFPVEVPRRTYPLLPYHRPLYSDHDLW